MPNLSSGTSHDLRSHVVTTEPLAAGKIFSKDSQPVQDEGSTFGNFTNAFGALLNGKQSKRDNFIKKNMGNRVWDSHIRTRNKAVELLYFVVIY